MSSSNGNNDNKDDFQGASGGEGNGSSSGLEPTATNSLVLYDNLFIGIPLAQEPIYFRAHQVAEAAAQAIPVPIESNLATGSEEIGRKGNKIAPVKPVVIRPRRPLPQEGRTPAMMVPRTAIPPHRQQNPESYLGASFLGSEEMQRHSGSVARTMGISPGSWGKGVKRRAPIETEEDDVMSGEKLNITQKLKYFDSNNQEVDVVGGTKDEDEDEVQKLSKDANKPEPWLLHKLLTDVKPTEAKPKGNSTATATFDWDMPPVAEGIHKKFEYKRWSAGIRSKSKSSGLVQGTTLANRPNLSAGPDSKPFIIAGLPDEPYISFGPVKAPYNPPALVSAFYTPPASVNGAQSAMGPANSPQISAFTIPAQVNGTPKAVGYFSGAQAATGFTASPYYGLGSFNGQNSLHSLSGTHYASGYSGPFIPSVAPATKTADKPDNGTLIGTGTLRELLSAKMPFQNPYSIVVPVPKGPIPSTSTSASATVTGSNGHTVNPPEQLQRMLGELVLSPFITETQAASRLKKLGTTQNVQAEIDRFAAIISCGNAFAANRANGQKVQQQQQEQQRADNATSISTAAKDLIQAKHRESVIKGVPKQ